MVDQARDRPDNDSHWKTFMFVWIVQTINARDSTSELGRTEQAVEKHYAMYLIKSSKSTTLGFNLY